MEEKEEIQMSKPIRQSEEQKQMLRWCDLSRTRVTPRGRVGMKCSDVGICSLPLLRSWRNTDGPLYTHTVTAHTLYPKYSFLTYEDDYVPVLRVPR